MCGLGLKKICQTTKRLCTCSFDTFLLFVKTFSQSVLVWFCLDWEAEFILIICFIFCKNYGEAGHHHGHHHCHHGIHHHRHHFSPSILVGFCPDGEAGSEAEFPPPPPIEGNTVQVVTSFQNTKNIENIAWGTTDPGYWLRILNHL